MPSDQKADFILRPSRRGFLKTSALTCLAALSDPKFASGSVIGPDRHDIHSLPIYWNGWNVLTDNPANASVSTFWKGSAPAAVARDAGHLDLFAIGNDSRVWTRSRSMGVTDSSWSLWLPIAGGPFSNLSSPAAVSCDSEHMDVFVMGNDSNVWTTEWSNGIWGGWVPLGGAFSRKTQPAVVARDTNHIDLFALGMDGKLYANSWSGTWSGWAQIQGGPFSPDAAPTAITRDPEHMDIFVLGNDGNLWTNSWSAGEWSGWLPIEGGPGGFSTPAAVVVRNFDHMSAFAIGTDNRVWTAEWADGEWGAWFVLSDDLSDPNASTFLKLAPSAASLNHDHVEVFVLGNDSRVWTKSWCDHAWHKWKVISDNPALPAVSTFSSLTPPVAIARDASHIELFVMGNDSRIWENTWGQPPLAAYVPLTTSRVCQETGNYDPQGFPHINDTMRWGLIGTDMGCPVEFEDKLYILFGDVPNFPGDQNPIDADPICYTTDSFVGPDGIRLSCVLQNSGAFRPFTISGYGTMGTNETPTGAFAHDGYLYAFVVRGNSRPYSTLTSTPDPSQDFTAQYDISDVNGKFWQIAPSVIRNSDWPGLPSSSGNGVLMWGQSWSSVYLAWMPLETGVHPPMGLMYYAGPGLWSPQQSDAIPVFSTVGITQISATWLRGPKRWLFLYTNANPGLPHESIVARIGISPWEWSDELTIFNPDREGAWGKYMHLPGHDSLNTLSPAVSASIPGYAYAPFCLNRYTHWNEYRKTATIYYLMATFVPYQVMLMRSQIQFYPGKAGSEKR